MLDGRRHISKALGFLALTLLTLPACSPRTEETLALDPEYGQRARLQTEYQEADGTFTKRYLIAPGDQFDVFVRNNQVVSRPVVVRPDGFITLPLIGDVKAEGTTIPALTDRLTERLSERLRDPEVSVIATSVREPFVYVVGEVPQPQPVPYRSARTVMQAIAFSGGLPPAAKSSAVAIIRINDEGRLGVHSIPVEAKGQPAPYLTLQATLLQPDDVVFVPARGIEQFNRAIDDFVNRPLTGVNSVLAPIANFLLIQELVEEDEDF